MKTLIGIDWSQKHHDIRLHNEAGALLSRFRIAHNWEGFQKLEQEIAQVNTEPGDCLIGIETANNMLVDFLGGQVRLSPTHKTEVWSKR